MKRSSSGGTDSPRKRRTGVDADSSPRCSSWDTASDDDQSELRQHEENLDLFCVNIGTFLDEFRDRAVTMIVAGELDPVALNADLTMLSSEMAAVLRSRENRPQIADARAAHDHAVATKRWLDARETSVQALYDNVARQFGWSASLHTPRGNPNCCTPLLPGSVLNGSVPSPGNVTPPGSVLNGSIPPPGNVTPSGSVLNGSVPSTGNTTPSGSVLNGSVPSPGNTTPSGSVLNGSIPPPENVTLPGSVLNGSVPSTGNTTPSGSVLNGSVPSPGNATPSGSVLNGSIPPPGNVTPSGSVLNGSVPSTGNTTPSGSVLNGSVPSPGNATPSGSVLNGSIPPPENVTLPGSVLNGSVPPPGKSTPPGSMVRAPQPSPQISEAIGSPGFPAGNGRGEPAVGVATGLPAFLAALKPKYDCFDARRCRQCHVPSSVVPAHWTDSFHRTLHRLRSAVMPPPSAFAAGRSRLSYRVISIRPERYNDEWLRGVRQYVDTELGLSETGIPRYTRSAYVSLLSGPAASVVGYLEAEPAAVAYVLGPDGQLSAADTGRRRVRYGVSRLWVTVGYRRLGIGTTMLNAFRADHSVHGRHVAFAAHEIQFGDAFVRHYCTAAARQDPVTASADVLIYTDSSAWYK